MGAHILNCIWKLVTPSKFESPTIFVTAGWYFKKRWTHAQARTHTHTYHFGQMFAYLHHQVKDSQVFNNIIGLCSSVGALWRDGWTVMTGRKRGERERLGLWIQNEMSKKVQFKVCNLKQNVWTWCVGCITGTYLYLSLSVSIYFYLSIYLSIHLSIYLSIYLSNLI